MKPPSSPGSAHPPGAVGPAELLVAGGFAAACGVGAALWATGQVAGLIAGGRWPPVGLADMAGVLVRLPGSVGNPARAWPAGARDLLPGAVGFYAVLLVLGALVLALLFAAVRGWEHVREKGLGLGRAGRRRRPRDRRLRSRRQPDRSARWARVSDVRRLLVPAAERGRVTLGYVGGRLVAAEPRQSVFIAAPTQSLKTTGLAVPALLEWRGPALAASTKTDLARATIEHRRRQGEVRVFDPTGVTGLDRDSWTPLAQCDTWEGARRSAFRLTQASQLGKTSDADFWARQGARYLAPLLFAARRQGLTMREVTHWVNADAEEMVRAEVREALGAKDGEVAGGADAEACRAALEGLEAVWKAEPRLRSSLSATVAGAVDAYGDPQVLECSMEADITAEWLLDGKNGDDRCDNTLYLCGPADEQDRLAPLFVALIGEIRAEVFRRAAASGEPIDPALLMVLDEAANIAPIPDLDVLASSGAGQGLQLVTLVQDVAQVHRRWRDGAETVVNNHAAKVLGSGTACPRTLDYFGRLLGEQELRQVSTSTQDGGVGHRSRTESSAWRAIAPANVLRESEPGTGLLVYRNLPPARVELRPWFDEPELEELVGRPAGGDKARVA